MPWNFRLKIRHLYIFLCENCHEISWYVTACNEIKW
jgi:hypothetical protein